MSDIRGLVIQSRLDYLEKLPGSGVLKQVLQNLPDPVRQAVGEQVFLTNLYPFNVLRNLDDAIGDALETPPEQLFREIGRQFASLILDRYFYNYMQEKNPNGFLAQIDRLYPHLFQFGKYTYQKSDKLSANIHLEYDEDIHKSYCWFVQEFLVRGVEICGGTSVILAEKACEAEDADACQYSIGWK